MDIASADLRLLKSRLKGSNLKKLISDKGLSKYRIAKDCGLTYRTLLNWQKEVVEPSDDNAIIVGRYLGLIKISDAERFELKKEFDEFKAKLQRLGE